MSGYSIISGVLDNDAKGTSGRGTRFWMEVRCAALDIVKRYEYTLMDLLDKTFDRDKVLAEVRIYAAAEQKAADEQREQEKLAAINERKAAIVISEQLHAVIMAAIVKNSKVLAEYKAGKNKALNALVGIIMIEARNKRISADAFAVTNWLKTQL